MAWHGWEEAAWSDADWRHDWWQGRDIGWQSQQSDWQHHDRDWSWGHQNGTWQQQQDWNQSSDRFWSNAWDSHYDYDGHDDGSEGHGSWRWQSAGEDGRDECRRHSMETYPTTQEPNSEGQQDGSDVAPVEPSEERSESATGSGKVREPKTGKEVVPGWDGSTPIRDYKRRIELFLATTGIDPEYRAGRLVEQLSGNAWRATETLSLAKLRSPQGVDHLLSHLQSELEPLEYLQVFTVLTGFYKGFRRARGEEMSSYDTRYRVQLQKLEEVGAGISGLTKAFWFLECASISEELRKQVIAAAGGDYSYEKLRIALIAIIPKIHREDQDKKDDHSGAKPSSSQPRRFVSSKGKAHRVNMVDDEEHEDPGEDLQGDDNEPNLEETSLEDLEEQAQVLMTQAAKKRAAMEKQRGFGKSGTQETEADRNKRIEKMKSTMACSACRSHGKVVYGHWHNDPQCPFYGQKNDKAVFCTILEKEEDMSEDSADAFGVYMSAACDGPREITVKRGNIALCDTCCARTVAGERWMTNYLKRLNALNIDCYMIDEEQAFRFGAGPKKHSQMAAIIPTCVGNDDKVLHLRVSIVQDDVPLLVSHRALRDMGAVMDLQKSALHLQQLERTVPLRTTASGHVGFEIWNYEVMKKFGGVDWQQLVETDDEVKIIARTRVDENLSSEPHRPFQKARECDINPSIVLENQNFTCDDQACSSLDHLPEKVSDLGDIDLVDSHGFFLSSKVEGGVRGVNCGSDRLGERSAKGPHRGPVARDLESGEAQQAGIDASTELEEIRSSGPQGSLCGHVSGILQPTSRRSLDPPEEGSAMQQRIQPVRRRRARHPSVPPATYR